MFTKESGILFVLVALAYTAITDKKRFLILLSLAAVATLAYIAANLGALGSVHNPHLAPIDELSLGQRLLNIPAIVWYYLTAFTFPLHLAHGYYWADAHIDWRHVLAPLFGLTATILVLVWGGRKLYRSHARRFFVLYCWFGFWLVVGLGIHLQLVPLDLTVSETWFYFPMIGLLGMLACLYEAFAPRRLHKWAAVGLIALLCIGGVRTAVRGLDWSDQAVLAYRDVRISPDDFNSENVIADDLMRQGKLAEARLHAQRSIDIYPRYSNYNTLGTILYRQRDYAGAVKAYKTGLTYQDSYALYANLAQIVASFGEPDDGRAFIAAAIKKFPQDGRLWFYLAVRDQNNGDNTAARSEIVQANRYGMRNADITAKIMQNQPLDNN